MIAAPSWLATQPPTPISTPFCLRCLHAAQVGEHLLLRLLAHRAGVEQDQVGLVHVLRRLVALGGAQHVDHLVRVVLVHLAAEGLDEYFLAHGGV
jgi:hypothetical protein